MALDLEVTSLDGLDDALKGLYVANGDGFKLDVSGIPDPVEPPDNSGLKKALDSERGLLKTAKKDLKDAIAAQAKFDGVDITQYNEVMAAAQKAKDDALIEDGKKDEVYAARLESNNSDWQKKLDAQKVLIDEASETFNTANDRIESLQKRALDASILNGINGVFHPEANEDAVMLASTLFKLNDKDVAVMTDETGKEISPKDWATSEDLKARKPHWYAASGNGTNAQQQQRNNEQQTETYKGKNQGDAMEFAREQQAKKQT